MFKIAAPLLPLLLPLSASAQPVEKGMPPISAQTQRSGGALSAERAALRLHSADLAIEVIPARQQLSGVATLELRTLAPVRQLRIDLDTNLPVSKVGLAGKTLPRAAWSHADGVLTVTPNSPVAAGASVTLRITYAGTPHVAVRAPWDDGIVWSQAPAEPIGWPRPHRAMAATCSGRAWTSPRGNPPSSRSTSPCPRG